VFRGAQNNKIPALELKRLRARLVDDRAKSPEVIMRATRPRVTF
jgi:hypothetical protein